MSEMKILVFKALAITLLFIGVITGWVLFDYRSYLNKPLNVDESGYSFIVNSGTSLRKLAYSLESKQVLDKPHYFIWHGKFSGRSHLIHAGEYQIEKGWTPKQLFAALVSGKVRTYSLTIVEGWTFKQMMAEVNKHPVLIHKLEGLNEDQIMEKLGLPGVKPEGRFFPDTYHFPSGTSDIDFLKRAYKTMEQKLNKEWAKRDPNLPIKTPYEALILASVVERETGVAAERGKIAGVFTRRLRKRMKLQSDPTVIYGMGERYKGNIRRSDLRRDTPYNTYTRFGLPITPIAMPSGHAIESVLHPEPGDTLYFVAKGDGSHYFSKTLREHNNAVIKYQLKGRKRPFSSYKPKKAVSDATEGTNKAVGSAGNK